MSREKDFIEAAERLAETKRTEDAKQQCLYDFGIAADYGYQYAVEHSDDVIRLIVRMAKKDIAFTEEEAVKFYHEEMEE